MLPSSSGSNALAHSFAYEVHDASHVGEVRRFAMGLGAGLGFDETRNGRVGIVANELGNNLVRYASGGRLICRVASRGGLAGVEILAVDKGPGFDTTLGLEDGYTTGSTPGTGLGAVRRLADEFDIHSLRGKGTVVFTRIYARDLISEDSETYEIGAVSLPMRGEFVCGDAWAVRANGELLHVIMVDGLGHGPQANKAALEAVDVFERAAGSSPDQLLQAIHGRLKSTRGGAVFILNVSPESLDFTGVGNIRAIHMLPGQTKTLISQNGTAGVQIRTVRTLSQVWDRTGYLVLHSDGISGSWNLGQYPGLFSQHPAIAAAVISRDFTRGSDDSTVLVIRRRA